MRLIVYYIGIMLILNVATVLIGFAVESQFGSAVAWSFPVALFLVALGGLGDPVWHQAKGRDRTCGRRRESISLLSKAARRERQLLAAFKAIGRYGLGGIAAVRARP